MSSNCPDNPLILGIDLEGMNRDLLNTGLDHSTDRVIEIGAVLWDWNNKRPVKIISELIDEADRLRMSKEVTDLTNISEESLCDWGLKGESIIVVLKELLAAADKADYLMAHNAKGYDKPMLENLYMRYGLNFPEMIWLDTMTDIEYPAKIHGRSLALLEHSHGFINPFPHRAMTDVLSMLKVACHYPVKRMAELASSPIVTLVAKLKAPDWRNKEEVDKFNVIKNRVAKSRFKWNPNNKTWFKEVPKILIEEGNIDYDFDWYPVE
jgi:DNA polymerase III subunit epsilon